MSTTITSGPGANAPVGDTSQTTASPTPPPSQQEVSSAVTSISGKAVKGDQAAGGSTPGSQQETITLRTEDSDKAKDGSDKSEAPVTRTEMTEAVAEAVADEMLAGQKGLPQGAAEEVKQAIVDVLLGRKTPDDKDAAADETSAGTLAEQIMAPHKERLKALSAELKKEVKETFFGDKSDKSELDTSKEVERAAESMAEQVMAPHKQRLKALGSELSEMLRETFLGKGASPKSGPSDPGGLAERPRSIGEQIMAPYRDQVRRLREGLNSDAGRVFLGRPGPTSKPPEEVRIQPFPDATTNPVPPSQIPGGRPTIKPPEEVRIQPFPDPRGQPDFGARARAAIAKYDGTGAKRAPYNNDKQLGVRELDNAGIEAGSKASKILRHGLGNRDGFLNERELVQAQKRGLIEISEDGSRIELTAKGRMLNGEKVDKHLDLKGRNGPATGFIGDLLGRQGHVGDVLRKGDDKKCG